MLLVVSWFILLLCPAEADADGLKGWSLSAFQHFQDNMQNIISWKTGLRTEVNSTYSEVRDFRWADPHQKRLLVIGASGVGKSTLLNMFAGMKFVRLVTAESKGKFTWQGN